MLYRLVINFLCEANLVDEVPIKSLLELINHDGTFLYHLMKRLGVDVSSIHNRLYHRSHTRANILSNHEVMLAFIATSGISPTLLPAPKVLYSASKEGIAANLVYQVLRCVYRKRMRQSESYIIRMANYLNALYTLRSEPVYQLTNFNNHTSLPQSLIKLSLSTSCISFSIFVAGVHRFLTESDVPCVDFLTNFYKFPTSLQHMTRNHAKIQHIFVALGIPLFFSPLAWLSIKDEEPYFDMRLIQIYVIFDKFRGCVSTILFKKLKTALFAPRSLDPMLPQPLNFPWRDVLHNTLTDPQNALLAFAKSTDFNSDIDDASINNDIDDSKKLGHLGISDICNKSNSTTIAMSHNNSQEMLENEYDNVLPKILPHEAEHLMMILSELPEPQKNTINQLGNSPTHYREAKTNRRRNLDPLSATHPMYSDEEHYKLIEARSYKSYDPITAPNNIEDVIEVDTIIENEQDIVEQVDTAFETPTNNIDLETCQLPAHNSPISTKEQLNDRIQKLFDGGLNFGSDNSEFQESSTHVQNKNKESSEDSQIALETHPSKHKESSSSPGALHMQVHHIHTDTIRHKSSLPHPCSMSPSAHKLSDECIQRSLRNHCEVITDSEDEVCSTITSDQIKEKYHICFIPPVAKTEYVSNEALAQTNTTSSTIKIKECSASGSKVNCEHELHIRYSESEDYPPLSSLPPPPPPPPHCPYIPYINKQVTQDPNSPQLDNKKPDKLDDRSSTDTKEYDLSGIIVKNQVDTVVNNDIGIQNFDVDSSYSDNFQFTVDTDNQGQAQIKYVTDLEDKISDEDFRLARVGLLSQSDSGKINSALLQPIHLSNGITKTEQLDHLANDPPLEYDDVISHSNSATTNSLLSISNLDTKAMEAQARYITQFPAKIQKYINEQKLIALSALPQELLKDKAAYPIDLTCTFIDTNGHTYRLYGFDFIRISVDGSVHIEPDEDLESDHKALKASLFMSNGVDSLKNHNNQGDKTGQCLMTQQSFIPSNNLVPSERIKSTDPQDSRCFIDDKAVDELQHKDDGVDLPLVQLPGLPLSDSNSPTSAHPDSLYTFSQHFNTAQDMSSVEARIIPGGTTDPCLIKNCVHVATEHIRQLDTYFPLNNDNAGDVAPLVCLDDLDDAGEAFLDTEIIDQPLQSDHVLVHDIRLPNKLDDHEAYSTIDGHSSVFSAQSMRKSVGISSASSKRSLNPMLSISSYTSRPNSSQIDREVLCAPDTTVPTIAVIEAPNDPIVAHVESPTTDRLVTAHGPRQNQNQDVGITPDPSVVCSTDEKSRPSTSSVAFNLIADIQTVPTFDLTPQIQLENLLTSKFMDRFIDSYLRKIQFRAPGIDKAITVDSAIGTDTSEKGDTLVITTKLGATTSFEQKLNQYVQSANCKIKAKSNAITPVSRDAYRLKLQTMQRQSGAQTNSSIMTRHTVRTAHLSNSSSAKNKQSLTTNNDSNEQPLPPALSNLSKEQVYLYNQINDAAHLSDNSPQLYKKLCNNKLAFSVPIRSPVQRFMYTLKCLNIDSSRISSEMTLFSVLRNNNSGFYLGVYARQYIVLRIEISDICKIERYLCQVYLHFRRAFVATGDNLLFAHFDLLDDRNAQSFVRDLTAAVEVVKPLMSER